ncbi:MAG: phosphohexomutase domain-containing protein [Planctomycetota bacterium]|jgi:phosphoglucosamine mutase
MTKHLFGTDGIRSIAGEGPLAEENVHAAGRALGRVLGGPGIRAVLCRDTRRSGPAVQSALTEGLLAEAVDVIDAGVRPTPALPALARAWDCAFGAVISASHNPMEYNGIKIFGPDGGKIPDAVEREIEREIEAAADAKPGGARGRRLGIPAGDDPYRRALASEGRAVGATGEHTLVVDCAHGATFKDAPAVLRDLGFDVIPLNVEPDGTNINAGCGALHPGGMADVVRERGALLGLALDGDGDRAILADEKGTLRDGDFVLAALARRFQAEGKLPGGAIVGTVMSNIGLEVSLAELGIALHRTPVGDRHVARAMRERGLALGGEPSGHVILAGPQGLHPGDGVLTFLHVLGTALRAGRAPSSLAGEWRIYPQTLVNVAVSEKPAFETIEGLPSRLAEIEAAMGGKGRVVLRYSGTEPVARVMVEGENAGEVEGYAEEIADLIRKALR